MKTILVTGAAGFIGFHMAKLLLHNKYKVIGYDSMNKYYDIKIKKNRLKILEGEKNFIFYKKKLEDISSLHKVFKKHKINYVIHLAAQAGVRHSIEHPEEYLQTNIMGTFNILECCRIYKIKHLLAASTSSVYGSSNNMPYKENELISSPMSVYAASKISTESLGHAYSYNWKIPMTFFRFFTVYGPWGRPDMALFKFTKNIYEGKKIKVFNSGQMYRDFTFIDDLVKSIYLLIKNSPSMKSNLSKKSIDSKSDVAPFRVINIGNSEKVYLLKFIKILEKVIGKKAKFQKMGMQQGDVYATHANTNLLRALTDFKPKTKVESGIRKFVDWYKKYYNIKL